MSRNLRGPIPIAWPTIGGCHSSWSWNGRSRRAKTTMQRSEIALQSPGEPEIAGIVRRQTRVACEPKHLEVVDRHQLDSPTQCNHRKAAVGALALPRRADVRDLVGE